jgi:hypothetical protein
MLVRKVRRQKVMEAQVSRDETAPAPPPPVEPEIAAPRESMGAPGGP